MIDNFTTNKLVSWLYPLPLALSGILCIFKKYLLNELKE